jgi:hypothetical protein
MLVSVTIMCTGTEGALFNVDGSMMSIEALYMRAAEMPPVI